MNSLKNLYTRVVRLFRVISVLFYKWRVGRKNVYRDGCKPLFSIVIPIYDRTDKLKEAIESVLNQTFVNFELLLICDGSPPDTIKIVKSYLYDLRVRVFFFDTNSGNPCRGRNKGIEIAQGDIIAFLDSDDISTPDRLEKSLFYLLSKNVDVVGGAIRYLIEDDSYRGLENGQIGFTSEKCTYDLLIAGNRLSICTVSVRKKCFEQFGFFREEMRYREDHELWLRLAYHGCTFYNSSEVFAQYRVHAGNAELKYCDNDSYWKNLALQYHCKKFVWNES